ncbi:hypothetical protein CRG98_045303 [Punica granatum]|uniref:Uncharacterized protein n=1 Tax=Punica granatum TaxID=22663 RepID=A0A2I0HRG5_PUNGR|nr:hypothetical protein CRG98_045303 [Punica granatum]
MELQRRDQELARAIAALERSRKRARGENFLASNSRAYGTQVLTTGGAPPVSHTLPIKNGRGKSTRCLRREYTTDSGSFSTAQDERATTTYPCRRTTSTSRSSLGPSPTTNFNKHATTWVRAATNDVYAVVGDSSTTACP